MSNQCGYLLFEVQGIKGSNRYEPGKVISLKETQKMIEEFKEERKKADEQLAKINFYSSCIVH